MKCYRCNGLGTIERLAVAGGPFPTCSCCGGSGLQEDVCELCLGAGLVHTHGGEKDPHGAGRGDLAPCPCCLAHKEANP